MSKVAKVSHPYISREESVCGGATVIKGTRIRIIDVAIEYEYMGLTPDEILEAHPHLELKQIHDALSYYYENREENDREIRSRLKDVDKLRKEYKPKLKNLVK
jgi:uncharacterized protein (DUF433 family)